MDKRGERTVVVEELVAVLFEPAQHDTVLAVLNAYDDNEVERVQCAVLKMSDGDETKLLDAAKLALTDYRDALMGAGFDHDVQAHLEWSQGVLSRSST